MSNGAGWNPYGGGYGGYGGGMGGGYGGGYGLNPYAALQQMQQMYQMQQQRQALPSMQDMQRMLQAHQQPPEGMQNIRPGNIPQQGQALVQPMGGAPQQFPSVGLSDIVRQWSQGGLNRNAAGQQLGQLAGIPPHGQWSSQAQQGPPPGPQYNPGGGGMPLGPPPGQALGSLAMPQPFSPLRNEGYQQQGSMPPMAPPPSIANSLRPSQFRPNNLGWSGGGGGGGPIRQGHV